MTQQKVILSRIGTKGQIVIGQKLREQYHLKTGSVVKQLPSPQGIIIQALDKQKVMERIKILAHDIGKRWPKDLDCVEVIRNERR